MLIRVEQLKLSEPLMKKWRDYYSDRMGEYIEKTNTAFSQKHENGGVRWSFTLKGFFNNWMTWFFTQNLEGTAKNNRSKKENEEQLDQCHRYLYEHISEAVVKIKEILKSVSKASEDWKKLKHVRHFIDLFGEAFDEQTDEQSDNLSIGRLYD